MMAMLIISVLIIPVVSATDDYHFYVGTHEVKFNTSTPIWEITKPSPGVTELGYEETYSPTYPLGLYASSSTEITARNSSDKTFLHVEIRDFDTSARMNIWDVEINTVEDFLNALPLDNFRRQIYFADGVALDNGEESFGVIVNWPTDKTEIIITGRLPNADMWQEISNSLKLVR